MTRSAAQARGGPWERLVARGKSSAKGKRSSARLRASTPVVRRKPAAGTGYSTADHSTSPPTLDFPRLYNAAADLLDPHLTGGRGKRVAIIDDRGSYTYAQLAKQVNRC